MFAMSRQVDVFNCRVRSLAGLGVGPIANGRLPVVVYVPILVIRRRDARAVRGNDHDV